MNTFIYLYDYIYINQGGRLDTLNIVVYTNFNIPFIGVRQAFPQWQYANEFTKPEFSGGALSNGVYTPEN